MYLTPLNFSRFNFSSKDDKVSGVSLCRQSDYDKEFAEATKPSADSRYVDFRRQLGDEFHPINLHVTFHKSGKLKDVEIDYTNGKFANGSIKESYDEEGNNINYEA